jgi:hypothetical protein
MKDVARLRRVVWLVAACAACAAGPAAAKGPDAGSICGGLGCIALSGQSETAPFISWWNSAFSPRGAPRPAPYYWIQLRDGFAPEIRWVLLYVPARRAMRIWQSRVPPGNEPIGPYWRTVPPAAADSIRVLVRSIRPYPTPRTWRR